jgi:hypothetical protein
MADRLGDARRANGARIESERRAIGQRMESERRANGRRIESERTGAAVQDDINSLVRPVVVRKQLATVPPVGALPLKRGRADYKAPAAAATGVGIASPLTEGSASTREYYDQQLLPSTDGLVWIRWKSVKKITMTDANSAEVVMEFKNGVP